MHRFFFFALFTSGLLACGGSENSSLGAPAPAPSVDAHDAGTAAPSSPAPQPSSVADAAAPPSSGPDNRIDPIELGHSWTYDVTILGVYPICRSGTNTGQVLGTKQVNGKQAFQVQSFCPGAGTSSYAVDGDHVEVFYGGNWLLALDAPVEENHSWSNGAAMFSWEKTGTMTVPAGTFDDCWTARQENSQSYTVFCRGVGPVKWHFVDGGNGYDAVLTAKSF